MNTRGLSRRGVLMGGAAIITAPWIVRNANAQGSGPITVGVLTDLSGPLADFAGPTAVVAAQMAVDELGGEVLGRPIKLISADHQNKPDVATSIARQWFDTQGVHCAAELVNSAVGIAVQTLAAERGKITLCTGSASTRLINENCSKTGFVWVNDTYANTAGPARMLLKEGLDSWFLIVADYAFGHQMKTDLTAMVQASGGKVLGSVSHPVGTADFSSFLLHAQASGAKVIGLLNAGADSANCVKQAEEFGLTTKQKLFMPAGVITDIHALGLKQAQGLLLQNGFYWDRNDESRAWSRRFFEKTKRMPGQFQAGCYSAVRHYLLSMADAKSDDGPAVAEAMRARRVNDIFAQNGVVRVDGRMVHDFFIWEVKSPAESKEAWDYYKLLGQVAGDDAVPPLSLSTCRFVKS